jgi:hypothetical protein
MNILRIKKQLHTTLVKQLEQQRDTLIAAQQLSSEGVTHPDAKSDGNKDMRATEASYIARGQALRANALEKDVEQVRAMPLRAFEQDDRAALSALALVGGEDGDERWLFLAPAGGGSQLESALGTVRVVTPKSPLGSRLVGLSRGDDFSWHRGNESSEYEVLELR